jgi:hypothetical protein
MKNACMRAGMAVNFRVGSFVWVPLTGQSFLIFRLWQIDRVQRRL